MGTRDAQLHIQIVDAEGNQRKPEKSDKVQVDGSDLKFDSSKGFVFKATSSGDIEVKVLYNGFAELRQHFEVKSQVENPTMLPFWPGSKKDVADVSQRRKGYILECMQFHRVSGGSGDARAPKIIPLTVTLAETREHVAVIGTDYYSGSPMKKSSLAFRKGAETYAYHLFVTGQTNSSSPHTVLDCEQGLIEVWMRAERKGWQRQFVLKKKKPARWKTSKSFTDWMKAISDSADPSEKPDDYIGPVDIYQYLSEVGASRPKTVIDFGIFSHAYAGGPILYNTKSETYSAEPFRFPRDPKDLDMRNWQDFHTDNTPRWAHMPKAFADAANIHVWGCFATTLYKQMIDYLRKGWHKNRDGKFFSDKVDTPKTRAEVITRIKNAMHDSYMGQIARHTGTVAWGGPPGYGGDLKRYKDIKTIPPKLRKRRELRSRKQAYLPRTTESRFSKTFRTVYESAELGTRKFDIFGFLRFDP